MPAAKITLRTCKKGHKYYKSSDCPSCPLCEQERKPENGFLSTLVAPARRGLENRGITTVQKLAKYSKNEILGLHGIGESSLPKLELALEKESLKFKDEC